MLVFCDSFDTQASSADLGLWGGLNSSATLVPTGGINGGGAVSISPGSSNLLLKATNSAAGVAFNMAFWFRTTAVAAANNADFAPFVDINGFSGYLSLSTTGTVLMFAPTGSSGRAALITGTTRVNDGAWHWIETQFIPASTSSYTAAMFIDGISQGTFSGTQSAGGFTLPILSMRFFGSAGLVGGSAAPPVVFDDLIMWDDTGSTFNTFPLGQAYIYRTNPSAAGASTMWTPSSGANYTIAAQNGWTGSGTLSSSTLNALDLYTATPVALPTSGTVQALQIRGLTTQTGASASLAPAIDTAGTTLLGAATASTTSGSATAFYAPFTADGTGTPWTLASVAAAQIGMELTAVSSSTVHVNKLVGEIIVTGVAPVTKYAKVYSEVIHDYSAQPKTTQLTKVYAEVIHDYSPLPATTRATKVYVEVIHSPTAVLVSGNQAYIAACT